jgi:hypothetical protein
VKTDPSIAVIATRHNGEIAQTTEGHAGNFFMTAITVHTGDSFEVALKRFNRKVQEAGILPEARRRRQL